MREREREREGERERGHAFNHFELFVCEHFDPFDTFLIVIIWVKFQVLKIFFPITNFAESDD